MLFVPPLARRGKIIVEETEEELMKDYSTPVEFGAEAVLEPFEGRQIDGGEGCGKVASVPSVNVMAGVEDYFHVWVRVKEFGGKSGSDDVGCSEFG